MSFCIGRMYMVALLMWFLMDLMVYPVLGQGITESFLLLVIPDTFKISNPPQSLSLG